MFLPITHITHCSLSKPNKVIYFQSKKKLKYQTAFIQIHIFNCCLHKSFLQISFRYSENLKTRKLKIILCGHLRRYALLTGVISNTIKFGDKREWQIILHIFFSLNKVTFFFWFWCLIKILFYKSAYWKKNGVIFCYLFKMRQHEPKLMWENVILLLF